LFSEKSLKKTKKKEITDGKIYSPVGNLAERAKQINLKLFRKDAHKVIVTVMFRTIIFFTAKALEL